jgi:hypothetical protein
MITNQYASNSIVPALDMAIKMPRDGAIIFADLIGKLDIVRVTVAA